MATIGSIAVNVVAKTDKFRKDMQAAGRHVETFGQRVRRVTGMLRSFGTAILGVAGIGGFGMLIKRNLELIDDLGKTSDRIGIATEQLIGLRHAAELSGVSAASLDKGIERMIRNISQAAQGTGTAASALREMKLSAEELNRMAPDRQLLRVSDALNKINSSSDRVRMAFDVFGRAGVDLLNLTGEGSEEIRKMIDETERLGKTLTREMVQRVEDANNAVTRLKGAFSGLAQALTVEVAPVLEDIANTLTKILSSRTSAGGGRRGPRTSWAESKAEVLQVAAGAVGMVGKLERMAAQVNPFEMSRQSGAIVKWSEEWSAYLSDLSKGILSPPKKGTAAAAAEGALRPIEEVRDMVNRMSNLQTMEFERLGRPKFSKQLPGFGLQVGLFARLLPELLGRIPQLPYLQGARPGMPIQQSPNAAIEAGTREAYIAQRQGQRQDHMKAIADVSKKSLNVQQATQRVLEQIREKIGQTIQAVTIPSA